MRQFILTMMLTLLSVGAWAQETNDYVPATDTRELDISDDTEDANPMESLHGEWRLVGWNDKGSWFEVDSSYVSHQHLTIDFKENGYVMAYSMANEICVGRLTLNGNEMIFGGEMRGWSTEVYVDMMENEFFEDHICDIKSYQLEGNLLRLYYTDDDYFVFSNEYLQQAKGEKYFYYNKDTKIPLIQNKKKVVVSIPKDCETIGERILANTQVLGTIIDNDFFDIYVITRSDYEKLTSLDFWKEDSKSVILTSCYFTEKDEELYATPYLNVELKKEKDIDLLTSYTEEYGIKIVKRVSEWMPLWYILCVTPDCKISPLECANKLWESGDFAAAVPDLAFGMLEKPIIPKENDIVNYRPFIEDGKVWRVMHGNISGKANFVNYYFSDEEIVKNNDKTYRTLYEQKDEEISPRSVGLLREEDGRVYLYDKNTNTEKIAYDFTLNEGDKFELQYEGGLPCEVTKVDSLVQQGNRLKRITFNITNGMGEVYEGTWIEGIGTYEEPLSIYPSTDPNSWSSSLEYVKSEKIGYWAFPFKFYRLRGQPMILGEDHSSEVSEEQWGHDDLHYKFIPGHPIGDDKDTLHVYGKMWLNCAPDQYMYCEEEGLMERNITLHTDAFLEDRDCFGYYDVDLRFPFFSATSGVQYTVTDKEGVHQVELRKDLEYRPFIEEGKVWKVGEFDQYGTFLPRLSYYYFDGDTIVGGKACKRMMCRHEANKGFEFEDGSLSYTNYAGAFYEENKQVYFALPTNDWFDRLYDFGAEIGETIDIYDWAKILEPHTSPFTITKKEEENSEFFKGICIEVNEKEELSHIKAVWREGIGGKEGPINNLSDRDALMSCTVGDEVLYKNPYFEDLYPDIESGESTPTPTAKRRVDFTHVVKKKPKAPQRRIQESEDVAVSGEYTQTALTIDLGTLQDTYAVTITDPSGQSVYAKDVKTNRVLALDIDISAYNTEDAYTITLENEDEIFEGNFRLSDLTNDLKYIELTKEERELVKNNNEFAFRLFNKARDDESCIMSPLSITYALGMLNNGADGQTREEINQVLGNVDNAASPELINQFCQKLLTEAPQLDKETTAEIANTIYVNRGTGYELQQGFVDKVNEYYDAQPQALDFYDDATIDIINQWADDHTHGMIPEIVDKTSFDHNAASILLNAIYFKGVWANKFDKAMTQDETFNGVETQPMMHQMEEFLYTENDLYQAVRLPYGNGAYEMTIFLPRKGKTIGEVLSQMDGKNWRPRYQSLYQVDLKMPRFQTETELPLNDTMKELGMPTAFTMGAEFPYFGNRDVFISQMFQKAKIELDEEGTKAAAVTEIWMAESACTDVAEFHANRPFFYIISEQSTGAIFFIGQYMGENPALAINSPALPLSKANNTYYDLTGRRVTTPTKGIYIHNGKIVMVK